MLPGFCSHLDHSDIHTTSCRKPRPIAELWNIEYLLCVLTKIYIPFKSINEHSWSNALASCWWAEKPAYDTVVAAAESIMGVQLLPRKPRRGLRKFSKHTHGNSEKASGQQHLRRTPKAMWIERGREGEIVRDRAVGWQSQEAGCLVCSERWN